jgi:type IV pilus assembly protein PilE
LGFTLIELLMVLAIVAILAAIAIPSYVWAIQKARRSDAIDALQDLALAQEQFRANCVSYARTLGGSDACDPATPTYQLKRSASSADGYYTISILNGANGTGFVATADPVGTAQASDRCGVFAINQDGPVIANPSYADAACWGR